MARKRAQPKKPRPTTPRRTGDSDEGRRIVNGGEFELAASVVEEFQGDLFTELSASIEQRDSERVRRALQSLRHTLDFIEVSVLGDPRLGEEPMRGIVEAIQKAINEGRN